MLSKSENYDGNKEKYSYTYDNLNRLANEVSYQGGRTQKNYEYDSIGNIISETTKTKGSTTTTASGYNNLNQLVSRGNTEYTYDKRGNLVKETTDGETSAVYEYDATNKMVKGATAKGVSYYTYNGLNALVKKNDTDYTIDYTSALFAPLVAENPKEKIEYVYGAGGSLIEMIRQDKTQAAINGNPATPESLVVTTDLLGSVRRITDLNGSTIVTINYTAWGIPTVDIVNSKYADSIAAAPLYTMGDIYDDILETYYARARMYDPETHRFQASDPQHDGKNWYIYCADNPLTRIDPQGTRFTTSVVKAFQNAHKMISGVVSEVTDYFNKVTCGNAKQFFTNLAIGVGVTVGLVVASIATGGVAAAVFAGAAAGTGLSTGIGTARDWISGNPRSTGEVLKETIASGALGAVGGGLSAVSKAGTTIFAATMTEAGAESTARSVAYYNDIKNDPNISDREKNAAKFDIAVGIVGTVAGAVGTAASARGAIRASDGNVRSTAVVSKAGETAKSAGKWICNQAKAMWNDNRGGVDLEGLGHLKTSYKEARAKGKTSVEAYKEALQKSGEGETTSLDIDLKYKEGWTPAQKAAADAKVKALTEANTVKTPSTRGGTSASARYKSAYGKNSVPQGYDVDHTIDLQLGGADNILNMNPLELSVNRSLGVQIKNAIKDYDVGTVFDKFTIH